MDQKLLDEAQLATGLSRSLCTHLFDMGWIFQLSFDDQPYFISPNRTVRVRQGSVQEVPVRA